MDQILNTLGSGGGGTRIITWIAILTTLTVAFLLLKSAQSYFRLRHIPGPTFAAFTNLVRRSWVTGGNSHQKQLDLHREYGTVIRTGPNAVFISQPAAVDKIYGFKARFPKSEFYHAFVPRLKKGEKMPDVFVTRDEEVHRQMRKPVANLYSVASLVSFEPLIISTIECFFSRLDELFADTGKKFNFFDWLQYFTFDVIGEVTFSRRIGFLEEGRDVDNVMEDNWNFFQAAAAVTQMPWVDYLGKDNPLIPASAKKNPISDFGEARINERLSRADKVTNKDFLACFIKELDKDPSLPRMYAIPTWTNSNIQAGGDTTSILASVIFYQLLKNPSTFAAMKEEVDTAAKEGRISKIVTWKESQTLPYLDACIKEAARLHPPIAGPLERVVPETGLEVDGYNIPPGTLVSMSPWTVNRNPTLFGEEPEAWRPERWLKSETEKKAMYNSILTFGAGHRSCLGKNLSYFELYKLIPSFLQRYDIELAEPQKEWEIKTHWFHMPSGFDVKISYRK